MDNFYHRLLFAILLQNRPFPPAPASVWQMYIIHMYCYDVGKMADWFWKTSLTSWLKERHRRKMEGRRVGMFGFRLFEKWPVRSIPPLGTWINMFFLPEVWSTGEISHFILFIYLFIFGCIGSLLQCTGFSLQWLLLLRSTGSRHAGFSNCGT